MSEDARVVIVTGSGGTGSGRAIAELFASEGSAVIVSDINEAGGAETARSIQQSGGRAAFRRADVSDELQVCDLIQFAESAFGGLSVLVNNASAPHPDGDGMGGWIRALQTDLLGAFHATRYAVEAMRTQGSGSIVNISSISALWHGRTTPGGLPGYDVAKSAVIRLTTGLAKDVAKDGIRVNCLAPGWIGTDEVREYWESLTPAQRAERGVPSKLLSTEEIAGTVVRIAGDRSLNGRIIVWWSEDAPRIIEWGDRGYRTFVEY